MTRMLEPCHVCGKDADANSDDNLWWFEGNDGIWRLEVTHPRCAQEVGAVADV